VDTTVAPTVTLTTGAANISETGATTTLVTATLAATSTKVVTVNLAKSGTATETADYTLNATITIQPGTFSSSVTLVAVNDAPLDEVDETVTMTASCAADLCSGTSATTTTIFDTTEPPTVTLVVSSAELNEVAGSIEFVNVTAILSATSTKVVTVNLAKSGTASETGTSDYTLAGTMTISAGSLSTIVTLAAVVDALSEDNETVIIDIDTVTNGTESGTQTRTVTILDNDPLPNVTLSVASATLNETTGTTSTLVTATLDNVAGRSVTVTVAKSGSAADTIDYNLSGTTITIPKEVQSASVTLTVVGDLKDEISETVVINITGVTNGAAVATGSAVTVTILDDDATPTVELTVGAPTIDEVAGTTTTITTTVSVTLSAVSGQTVTVILSKSGTATDTADYTLSNTTITLTEGTATGTVTLTSIDDFVDESNETIVVDIFSVTNADELGGANGQQKSVSIVDDDATPTVSLSTGGITINESTPGNSTPVTVTLNVVAGRDVTVTLAKTGGAIENTDYTLASGITIPKGQLAATTTLSTITDLLDEADQESVVIDINTVENALEEGGPTGQTRTVNILDDDAEPTVTLSVDSPTIGENTGSTTTTVRATLSAPSTKTITVTLAVNTSGTASSTDFTLSATTLTIAGASTGGSNEGTALLAAQGDSLDETDETVIIDITAVTNGSELGGANGQQKTVTISDDDATPTVALSVNFTSLNENTGTTSAVLTATLSAVSGQDVTVNLKKDGTATESADYSLAGTISIPKGTQAVSTTLAATGDLLDEVDETIIVSIQSLVNATNASTPQTITILDDDALTTVSLSVVSPTIDENVGTTSTLVTATLNLASGKEVTVTLVKAGTATETSDYNITGLSISIPAGTLAGSITVTSIGDAITEPDETVIFDIDTTTNTQEQGTQQKTVTIANDDPIPTVTLTVGVGAGNITITEGSSATTTATTTVTATLSNQTSSVVTINLGKTGTATDGSDYTLSGGNVISIPAFTLSASVTLTTVGDVLDETNETVIIDITSLTNATELGGVQQKTVTIADDDATPTVTLSADNSSINESGAGNSTNVRATLSATSNLNVTVTLSKSGTAADNTDYTLVGTINILAGESSAFSEIVANNNALDEFDKSVIIDIAALENGTEATQQQQTITIIDDDATTTVTLSVGTETLDENTGATSTSVTATLNVISGKDVTVTLDKTGSAFETTDYALPTTITILKGALSATVTLSVVGDTLNENNETVIIDINNTVVNGIEFGLPTGQRKTVTILNDDPQPTVTLTTGNTTVNEDGTGTTFKTNVTATLSAASSFNVVVTLAKTGTAIDADYTLDGTITISALSNSALITLQAKTDVLDEDTESVIIDIDAVTNGQESGTQTRTVAITDNDPTPTISLGVGSTIISESGATTTTPVTATLDAIAGRTVIVNLAKTGTATNVADYTLPDTITIPALTQSVSVSLIAVNDTPLDEVDETVTITASCTDGILCTGSSAQTVTIEDTTTPPSVTLTVGSASISETGATTLTSVTATLAATSTKVVTVNLAKTGSATETADYTLNATVTIPVGTFSASVTLVAVNDAPLDEADETVTITGSCTNNTCSGSSSATTTIVDTTSPPTVTLTTGSGSINETGATTTNVIATLNTVSAKIVTVNLAKSGVAVETEDYTLPATITISPNTLSASVQLAAVNDAPLDEADETLIITSSCTDGTCTSTSTPQVIIVDTTSAPAVTLNIGVGSISETGATTTTVTAMLANASAKTVTVNLAKSGVAMNILDYTLLDTMTISVGLLSTSITLAAVNDAPLDEAEESLTLTASCSDGTCSGSSAATTTIVDTTAPPAVTLTVASTSISETGTTTKTLVTATLADVSAKTVTVNLAKSGTATETNDYTLPATITISAGTASSSVTLTAVNDAPLDEVDEEVIITASCTDTNCSGSSVQTVTLVDTTNAPTVSLTVGATSISETGATTTLVTATLTATSTKLVTVNLARAGTATNGADYTLSTTITVPVGSFSAQVQLAAINDSPLDEVDETVDLTASCSDGTCLGSSPQTVTILDTTDQPTVTLNVGSLQINEIGGTTTAVTALLSSVSSKIVTVTISKTNSTNAIENTDYTLGDTITIPVLTSSAAITFTVVHDLLDEVNETVTLNIIGVTNGTIGTPSQQIITILDNDDTPTVTLTVGTSTIAESGVTSTTGVTATLSAPSGQVVTVFLTKSGTATETATSAKTVDYTLGNSITITLGASAATTTLLSVDDARDESDTETVVIDISSVTNADIFGGTQRQTVSIADDDVPSIVTLSVASSLVNESGTTTNTIFTATLTPVAGRDVIVNLDTTGAAVRNVDYTLSALSITIPEGSTGGSIVLFASDDALDETDEAVFVFVSSVTNANNSSSAQQVNVIDNDPTPTVTLSVGTNNISESLGTVQTQVTATLSAVSGLSVTVNIAKSGTAIDTLDYSLGTQIIIPIETQFASITLATVNDTLDEVDETVIIDITTVTNGTENGTQTQTVTIKNDSVPPTVTLSVGSTTMGENAGATSTPVTATLSKLSGLQVTVNLAKSGTAADSVDYILGSPATALIVIPAGSISAAITLAAVGDTLDETDETVTLSITTITNGSLGTTTVATVTIPNDDTPSVVTLSVGNTNVAEEGSASTNVTATLNKASSFGITVTLTKTPVAQSSGAMIEGTDFVLGGTITIPALSTTASITFNASPDSLNEFNEAVTIDITVGANATEGSSDGTNVERETITIVDNDPLPVVTLSVGSTSVSEAGVSTTVTATSTAPAGRDVTINLATSGTTVAADFTLAGSMVIPALGTATTTTLSIVNDTLDEDGTVPIANETVVIDISGVTNGTEGSSDGSGTEQETVTIVDDDALPTVTFTFTPTTVFEDSAASTTATVTATLNTASGLGVTVNFAKSGNAIAADYSLGDLIVIAAGQTANSITMTVIGDLLNEGNETVTLDITTVVNGAELGTQTKTVTITDDDAQPTVTLSVGSSSVGETGGTTTVTATLSAPSGLPVTVNLATSGTATSTDFTLVNQIVVAAGATTTSIVLTGSGDALDEDGTVAEANTPATGETVTIDITTVTNGTESGAQTQTVKVVDDDNPPTVTLTAGAASITEASGATNVTTITATLTAPSGLPVTVNLAIATSATAVAADFTLVGPITIAAGATTTAINLTATDDSLDEDGTVPIADETVVVEISSITNGIEGSSDDVGVEKETVRIIDNDALPTVTFTFTPTTVFEDSAASTTATVTATLNTASGLGVTVNFAKSGNAIAADYSLGDLIVIAAGQTANSITMTVIGDLLNEGNETVTLDITTVVNGAELGTQTKTVTITDDDAQPTVTLSVGSSSVGETGGTTTVTATLSAPSGLPVTVNLATSGTATSTDFTLVNQIVVAAGATTTSIVLTGSGDALDEDGTVAEANTPATGETVTIDITTVTNGTESGAQTQTVKVVDDDNPPTVTLTAGAASITEESGATNVTTITATLTAPSAVTVTVNLAIGSSSTAVGADFTLVGPITINAGATTTAINLTATNDLLDEDGVPLIADETVVVEISSITNGIEGSSDDVGVEKETVRIIDNDAPPTVTFTFLPASLGEDSGVTSATVTATLSTESGLGVTVNFTKSGSATSADYSLVDQIIVTAGQTSGSMTLTVIGDSLDEVNELVTLDISTVINGSELGTQTKTVTIVDDDVLPIVTVAVGSASIAEANGTTTVTATLNTLSGLDVTVPLTKTGSTATETADYTLDNSIVISAGTLSKSITLAAEVDNLDEDGLNGNTAATGETVVINVNGTITNGTTSATQTVQTVSIVDDDNPPTVTLLVSSNTLSEAFNSAITVSAQLSVPSGLGVTVTLAKSGTATDGGTLSDYTMNNVTITIPAGDSSASLSPNPVVVSDTKDEDDETLILDIASVTNGTESGGTSGQQQIVTIQDDDNLPEVSLAVGASSVGEASGTTTVTASVNPVSGREIRVTLSKGGNASSTDDYGLSALIVIPADTPSVSNVITASNDALDEADEAITLDIQSVTNATATGTPKTVTIIDNDDPPLVSLSIGGTPIAENGGTTTVTATLVSASGLDVTVTVQKTGSATETSDYTFTSTTGGVTTISILAGGTSKTITLTGVNDLLDEDNETVIVAIGGTTNATATGTPQTITITDDDAEPTVTLIVGANSINENTGATSTLVTARLSVVSGRDVTISLGKGGTATNSTDYTLDNSIVILKSATSTAITLAAVGDTVSEANETVVVDITGVTNGSEQGVQQLSVTIIDDDTPPTVTLTVGNASISETNGSTQVTASLSASSAQTVTVDLVRSGTATITSDYTLAGQISITPGQTSGSITLAAVHDTFDEADETVVIDISTVTNGTENGTQTATTTILDDDASPTVTLSIVGGTTINETGSPTNTQIRATLSAESNLPVTVSLTKTGSAQEGNDYTLPIEIVVPALNISASVTLQATNDSDAEEDETVVIDITGVTNGSESGTQTATATIVSEDVPVAPTGLAITYNVKKFDFSWTASTNGATSYELHEDKGDGTGFSKIKTVTGITATLEIAVHIHNWPNGKYKVKGCVKVSQCGSLSTGEISTANAMLEATGYLKASTVGPSDQLGFAVAISGDGSTAAVGMPTDSALGAQAGTVHVYKKDTLGVWTVEGGTINATNAGAGDQFGYTLSLSDDGNTMVVGAPFEDGDAASTASTTNENAVDAGTAYVFTRSGGTWTQKVYVKASNANTGDLFGSSVTVSGDATRFVVGAPLEDTTATTSGAAYVFAYSGGTTVTPDAPATLKATTPASGADFGGSVAINETGSILAVGASEQANGGSVYTFTLSGTTWSAQATKNAAAAGDKFGKSVAISDDGTTLAVGAPYNDSTATNTGAVYIFTGTNFADTQATPIASNKELEDHFGHSVALSQTGDTLIVGAPDEDSNATSVCTSGCGTDNSAASAGAVYRYTRSGSTWTEKTYIKATNTGAGDQFGFSVSVSDSESANNTGTPPSQTLIVGAPFEDSSISAGVSKGNSATNDTADAAGAAYLH
jgi:hypothetical protein